MNYTTNSQEVSNVAASLNLYIEQIALDKCHFILNKIIDIYTDDNKYYYPLWENMVNDKNIRYKQAWKIFKKIFKSMEVVLFFDYAEDQNMFLFKDGGVLTEVLENCFGFTIYVTNSNYEFLIAYNDHEYLLGSGEAIKWIEELENGKIT